MLPYNNSIGASHLHNNIGNLKEVNKNPSWDANGFILD